MERSKFTAPTYSSSLIRDLAWRSQPPALIVTFLCRGRSHGDCGNPELVSLKGIWHTTAFHHALKQATIVSSSTKTIKIFEWLNLKRKERKSSCFIQVIHKYHEVYYNSFSRTGYIHSAVITVYLGQQYIHCRRAFRAGYRTTQESRSTPNSDHDWATEVQEVALWTVVTIA